MDAKDSRILSRIDCWAASLASMEVILVLTGSELILRITEEEVLADEEEEEVGGPLEFADEEDSLFSGKFQGTIEECAEDEEQPDLLLEEADVRDCVDLDARLMLEMVRGIGWDSFEGVRWRGMEFWFEEEEVRTGSSGGSNAELIPFWFILRPRKSHEESAESREGRTYRNGSQPANLLVD